MRRVCGHRLLWALAIAAAGVLLAPAAAQAAALGDVLHPTFGLFGISIKDVVGKILKAVVGFFVPDLGGGASAVVTWLVAVPNVTLGYPSLRELRLALVPVGISLASLCFTAAMLEYLAAGIFSGSPFKAVETFGRTVLAISMIAFFPKFLNLAITGTNLFTAQLIKHPSVVDGLDTVLAGALVLAAVAGALSLGLAAAAALIGCYFLIGLFMFKTGATSILAVLYVASPLVWGLYGLPATRWLARAHTAGLTAALLLPIAWSLIFATGGLLGRDALLWTNPATSATGGLADELEALARPFAAVACLYVAYKAPMFLTALARSIGLSPAAVFSPGSGGSRSGGGGGRAGRLAAHGTQRAADRFRGLRVAGARAAGRSAAPVGSRAASLRANAAGRARRVAGTASLGVAGAASPRLATGAIAASDAVAGGARRAGRATGHAARGAKRGTDWWRTSLPADGAAHRRGRKSSAAAFRSARADARAATPPARRPGAAAGRRGALPQRLPRPGRVPPSVVALASGRSLPAIPAAAANGSRAAGRSSAARAARSVDAQVQRRAPRAPRPIDPHRSVSLQARPPVPRTPARAGAGAAAVSSTPPKPSPAPPPAPAAPRGSAPAPKQAPARAPAAAKRPAAPRPSRTALPKDSPPPRPPSSRSRPRPR